MNTSVPKKKNNYQNTHKRVEENAVQLDDAKQRTDFRGRSLFKRQTDCYSTQATTTIKDMTPLTCGRRFQVLPYLCVGFEATGEHKAE